MFEAIYICLMYAIYEKRDPNQPTVVYNYIVC